MYDNLFNRAPDAGGLDYWVGATKVTLASGEFVGSILVDILAGARNTPDGLDVTALMGKVIVGLHYGHQQEARGTTWTGAADMALAKQLIDDVTSGPQSVLVGIRNADAMLAVHGSA